MRFFYSFILYLISPWLLLRLWWKGRGNAAYRQRISERFAVRQKKLSFSIDIWIHTVSVGEAVAAFPLIEQMLLRQWKVLVTTMTPTGAARVEKQFGSVVEHRFIPYDLPGAMARFYQLYQPKLGLIVETELWPNLIYQAKRAHIPLFLINARLSEKSYCGYKKIRFFMRALLEQFSWILTQTEDDMQRFISLGAHRQMTKNIGNLKFDLQLKSASTIARHCKEQCGKQRFVMIAASTHDNEEEQLIAQFKILQKDIPDILLIIAPRHPERFQSVFQLTKKYGFISGLCSKAGDLTANHEIIVLDLMGELCSFYTQADCAFVGGSLVPVGGHNVLEPIAVKIPVLCGPYMHNFADICNALKKHQALIQVKTIPALMEEVKSLYSDKERRAELVENAERFLKENQGVTLRYLEFIEKAL